MSPFDSSITGSQFHFLFEVLWTITKLVTDAYALTFQRMASAGNFQTCLNSQSSCLNKLKYEKCGFFLVEQNNLDFGMLLSLLTEAA